MKKGFTLIEIVIAMFLISVIVVAIADSFGTGMKFFKDSMDTSENSSTASSYMQNYLNNNDNTKDTDGNTVITENIKDVIVNDTTVQMDEVVATKDNVQIKYYK